MRVAIWGALCVADMIAGHWIVGGVALLLLLGCATPPTVNGRGRRKPLQPASAGNRGDRRPDQLV